MFNVVVLPQPDGPSRVRNSPCATSRETFCTAVTSPNRLVTPTTATSVDRDCSTLPLLLVDELADPREPLGNSDQRQDDHDSHDRHGRDGGIETRFDVAEDRDRDRD